MEPKAEIGQIPPTQVLAPWRATLRTLVQAFVGLCVLVPSLVALIHTDESTPASMTAAIAVSLAVSGAVTRAMAMPGVNAWLERFVPWLAASPQDDSVSL